MSYGNTATANHGAVQSLNKYHNGKDGIYFSNFIVFF